MKMSKIVSKMTNESRKCTMIGRSTLPIFLNKEKHVVNHTARKESKAHGAPVIELQISVCPISNSSGLRYSIVNIAL